MYNINTENFLFLFYRIILLLFSLFKKMNIFSVTVYIQYYFGESIFFTYKLTLTMEM